MDRGIGAVAYDPSGPSGHLPSFAREEKRKPCPLKNSSASTSKALIA